MIKYSTMINITPSQEITKIYLVTNCFGDPNKVYIGKEKHPKIGNSRFYDHKKSFGNQIIFTYIDQVESLNSKDWKPLECFWIEYFRQLGFNLQNKNNGGGGVDFCSEQHKLNISKSLKGKIKIKKDKNSFLKKLQKKVYQYDLDGNFIKEWESIKNASYANKCNVSSVLRGKQKTAGGFIWKYNLEFNLLRLKHKSCRKTYQFSINGNLIRCWDSIKNASDTLNLRGIVACCKGKTKTCGGFVWRYSDNFNEFEIEKYTRYKKKIIQYDISGFFIREWDSLKEASEYYNISSTSITACLKGKSKTSKGYLWKYK